MHTEINFTEHIQYIFFQAPSSGLNEMQLVLECPYSRYNSINYKYFEKRQKQTDK